MRGGHRFGRVGMHLSQPHFPEQDQGLHQPPEEVSDRVENRSFPHRSRRPESSKLIYLTAKCISL